MGVETPIATNRPRLVVDSSPLSSSWAQTGVARWTREVTARFEAVALDWDVTRISLGRATGNEDRDEVFTSTRLPTRVQRVQLMLGLFPDVERWVPDADVMLGSSFVPWPSARAARVPVVHDLCFVKHPRFVSLRNRVFLAAMLKRSVRAAKVVITVSSAIRDEVVEHYGVGADRVAVVPNGCDHARFNPDVPVGRPQGVPDEYLLFVGTLEPRKNLSAALEAHARLRRARSDVPPLVIVGKEGWRRASWGPSLDAARANGDAIYLGPQSDATLASLYAGARLLVFPSFYEGFGLPALEAMACGCPILVSGVPALREVAGEAGLYVGTDARAIADGLEQALDDEASTAARVRTGIERAKTFTWEASAIALRSALEAAIAR